jgi:hypothetical protein
MKRSPRLHRLRKFAALHSASGGWRNVSPPAGWTWELPFTLQRRGRVFRPDPSFDLKAHANCAGSATYYVDRAASGANNGSSWEDAFTGLWNALAQADARTIYVAKGYYYRNEAWSGSNPASDVEVIGVDDQGAGDGVYLTGDCHNQLGNWSLAGNHYEAADGGRTIETVWDHANPDASGSASRLTERASAAEVDANPGSWFQDAATVYIRTLDSRQPDSDIYTFEPGTVCNMIRDNQALYVENLNFRGGRYCCNVENASAAGGARFYARDCTFQYGHREDAIYDMVSLEGLDESILWGCAAEGSPVGDGFNYKAKNGIAPKAIEIDCTSRNHGDSAADQASTMHDAGEIVRINGQYCNTAGQVIADVGAALSWNLGVYAYGSGSDDHFWIEGAGGKMWLDRCKVDSSGNYDITAGAGANAYVRSFLPLGYTSSGAVASY